MKPAHFGKYTLIDKLGRGRCCDVFLAVPDAAAGIALNEQLSRERADTIASELIMRGVHPSVVTGFGTELPVASNDVERGRARNRRVEVWFEHR